MKIVQYCTHLHKINIVLIFHIYINFVFVFVLVCIFGEQGEERGKININS